MNEFTSQYLKRREELSGRQSGFTPAVIPLPTFSNAMTFQQRTKERTPSAPEPERVALFRNDLLSKVSEKRVPDLSTRLRIRSESDAMRAEDLTRERRDILGFNPAPTQEQRNRVAEIDREREALRQRSGQLREDARWAEYGQLRYRPDFSANSSRPRSTLDDVRRRAGGEAVDERYLVGLEHSGYVGSMEWIERARQLTDDELAMYNYLRNTEGQGSADDYLDLMEETLNQRVGGKQAEDIANIENPLLRTAATGAYAVGSGLDQFGTGVQQLFTEEALPTTATQFGAAQVREDLADASPSIGGKPLVLPGGASLGQAAFDLVSSAANMAPGLALSAATAGAGAAPWLSGLAASGSLGASSGGNAYNEAVKQGYTPAQARSYAILTGASEGGLQYLLGGIGALGGRVSRNVIQNTVKNIDNALLRAGAELGLNMLSEGAEEYLQEVLTPVFRNIALDENNPVELVSEEAIYAGILGALSAGVLEGPGRVSGAVSDARTDRSIDRAYSGMAENGIDGFTPRRTSTARSTGQYGTSTSDAWYNRNADVQLLPSRETEAAPAPEPEQARRPSPLSKDEAERLNRIFAKTPPETAQDGGLTLPTASGAGAAAPRGDVRELTLPGGEEIPISQRTQLDAESGIKVYRGSNRSKNPLERNLAKKRTVFDVIGKGGQEVELVPLEYYTSSYDDAQRYANHDRDFFEAQLIPSARMDYKRKLIEGKDPGLPEDEWVRNRAEERYRILMGRDPVFDGGSVDEYTIHPQKVLDLSEAGEQATINEIYNVLSRQTGISHTELDDALLLLGVSDEAADGGPVNVYNILRNNGNHVGTRFYNWMRQNGFDAVKYLESGAEHYAIDRSVSPIRQQAENHAAASPEPLPVLERVLPGGDSGVVRMSLDEYLGRQGLSAPISDYMDDKLRLPYGETQRQRARREADANAAADDYAARRQAAIQEYNQKVQAGKITPKSRIERLIETARGHDDNESVQAARRALEKRGIDWRVDEGGGPLYAKGPESSVGAARADFTGDTVRGFSRNLATDRARHQDVREDFELAPEKYFRLSNRETLKKAQDIFSAGLDSARSTVEQAIGAAQAGQKLSPEMVPLSKMVADALAARGDLDGARNILASMAAELTSAGQLGQAARILRDADPQATIDSVEKIVKKLNEELGSGGNGGTSGSTEITEKAYRALKESRDDAVRLIQNIISAFQDQSTEQTDPLSSRYRRTWVEQLGRELANRAAAFQTGRTSNPTAYQTILGDLTAFMNSYLSRRKQSTGAKRTAAERLADFFQNREEYAAAWNQAKDQLRARYGKDRQMMDRLEDFLNGTISYSGAGSDAVMLEAVTRAALENDVNMDRMIVRQQYDEDDLAGQVADTLIRQTGAEGSDQQIIRDAVLRHIREKTADAGRGSGDIIHRDIQNAMRKLGVRLSQVIEQGARSKEELARNIASVLSGEYGVSENVSQSLSQDIVDDFGRMVEDASRKKLKQIFSKRPKAERRTMEQAFERLVNLGAFYNGEYSGQAAGRVFGTRAKGIQIDQALIDEFSRQTTDEGRADVLDKIYQNVADQIPSTFMDKFNALRYLNMLGNLKTQVRNVGGNLIMKGVRAQRVKLQAAMENLAERAARAKGAEFERTVSLTRDREIFKLAKAEFDRAAEEIMGERKYSYNGQSIPAAIQNRRAIFKVNGEWGLDGKGPASLLRRGADALMGGLEAYRRLTNWAMEKGDMFFAGRVYADALSRYLKANGVTAEQYRSGRVDEGLMDRARQRAVKEAQEATFRDSNAFSDMIAKIGFRNPKNGIEKAANMAVQGVLPFRRTPANVGVRAVEYSPLGLIDTAVKAAKVAKGSESVTSADVIASLSKTLTGTGLFALGVALGMGGMLSGLSSDDENEAELDEQEGRQAYALYLPDWLTGAVGLPQGFNLTLDWASPAAVPLFMGAELGNQAAGNGVQGKDILTALASSSNVLLNMSMLQGINDQLENISYSENPLVDLTLNSLTDFWTAGLTSTLGGQIERTLEDVRMSTYTDENSELPTDLQYELGSQLARVPGVDYQQIPFVDSWGRTESIGHWLPRAGNQFLNPSYASSDTSTPAIQETRRLYEATGDGGVVSKRPDKEITVDSQTKYLSAGEYLQYATERGQMRDQLVTDIIGRDAYQDMGAAEQAAVIKDVYSYTDAIAKSHISEYEPSSWVKKVETYGVDPADAILYRAAKRALEDADVEGVTSELRSMLMEDTALTSEEKAAIDKAILSEKSKVDYSSQESFLISQMSDAAQSKWPGIRDRFGLSAEEYQEAVRIYNMDKDDGVTTADKKRMLRELFGWEGNAIYKALGKKADSDEED